MFSLQKLLGKEDKFFTLLEASAEEARVSVQTLAELSRGFAGPSPTHDLAHVRRKEERITQEITEAVYTTFITAIEREDIQSLANALNKVPKTVEKFTERALIAPRYLQGVDFSKQIGLLQEATEVLLALVKSLRNCIELARIKELTDKLQSLESEGDKHLIVLYGELYSGRYDAARVLFLKDLYELLERAIDRCRTAGNVISHICLKNS